MQTEGTTQVELRSVKAGDYVKLQANGRVVWKKGAYDRSSHCYELTDTEDINRFRYIRAQQKVFVGLTY